MLVRVQSCAPKYKRPQGGLLYFGSTDAPNRHEIAPAAQREARSGIFMPSGPHEPKASGDRQSRAGSSPVLRTSFTTLQRRRRRRYGTRGPHDHFVPRLLALDAAKRQNHQHLQWVLLRLGSSPVLRTSINALLRRRRQNHQHRQWVLLLLGSSPALRTTLVEGLPWRRFFMLRC